MKNVLILGASGQIAQWVSRALAQRSGIAMTLFLRNPKKISGREPASSRLVIGSALDKKLLEQAMSGQDIVYANLTGDDIDAQARSVVAAMRAAGVKRLVFVLSLGIYDEVPGKFGEWNRAAIGARRALFLQRLRSLRDGVSLATARSFAGASPTDPDALQRAAQTLHSGNDTELPAWLTHHPGRPAEPFGKLVTRPWSNRHNGLFIVRLSLCMVAGELIRQVTPFGHGYWILLTVALCLKPDITSVFSRSLQRGVGTAIGVAIASFVALLAPGYGVILVVGLLCAGIPYSVRRNYAWFSVLITPVVLLLLDLGGTAGWSVQLQRVVHTTTGCALVLVLAYALWPDTWRPTARPEIADLCDRLAIAQGIAGLRQRAVIASSEPQGPRLRARHWQDVTACLDKVLQAIVCAPPAPPASSAMRWFRRSAPSRSRFGTGTGWRSAA